jgi:hypothetical protein
MKPLQWLAHVMALLALAAIGFRPTWRTPGRARDVVLSTIGADPAVVRRLADSLGKALLVTDPADLRPMRTSVRRLFVAGWGLDAAEWQTLDSIPVTFHPTPVTPGISRASWPAEVILGDRLVVEGDVTAARRGQLIYLEDPSGATDSARLDSSSAFRLEALPRATGRSLYVLRTATAHRSVAAETLGVAIVAPPAWRVLVLEGSPRFETSALRDWLVARGSAVAIRTAVSRNRFRTEFVNRDSVSVAALTARLVSQFDVTVIDGRTLATLTASERLTLRRAVASGGLGVLVIPDTVVFDPASRFSDREFFLDFSFRRIETLDVRLVRPHWAGLDRPATVPASAEPYTLANRFGTESLIEDGTGNVLAQVAPRGAGRVGLSLVTGSARWLRGGEREAFSAYWSRVLSAVAGGPGDDHWTIETPGPWLVHQPLVVDIATSGERQVTLVVAPSGARDSVFLARDPLAPTHWRGTFWPREPGWHEVAEAGGTAFYVQPAGAWWSRQGAERLDATARHLVHATRDTTSQQLPPGSSSQPIPAAWFFALFLLSAGYLWSLRRTG